MPPPLPRQSHNVPTSAQSVTHIAKAEACAQFLQAITISWVVLSISIEGSQLLHVMDLVAMMYPNNEHP